MSMSTRHLLLLFSFFVANCASLQADFLTFNLVIPSSSLTLSGIANVPAAPGSFAYSAQGAGSLITSYGGTFVVNVDNVFNPTTISFVSANLDANSNGSWRPNNGGGADTPTIGDYGMSVPAISANAKLRDIVFNLSAATTGVTAGTGAFSIAGQTLQHTAGSIDVFAAGLGGGDTATLTSSGLNVNAGAGTYTVAAGIATVTIPVTFTAAYAITGANVTGTNTFTGTLVGVTAVPEPTSILLCSMVGIIGLSMRRRSLRRQKSAV